MNWQGIAQATTSDLFNVASIVITAVVIIVGMIAAGRILIKLINISTK